MNKPLSSRDFTHQSADISALPRAVIAMSLGKLDLRRHPRSGPVKVRLMNPPPPKPNRNAVRRAALKLARDIRITARIVALRSDLSDADRLAPRPRPKN
jgi:hypothetical protein